MLHLYKHFSLYTERDSKIGFGLERKLLRIDDRKSVNIRNMNRLTIVDSQGFGQAENPIFESRSVYITIENSHICPRNSRVKQPTIETPLCRRIHPPVQLLLRHPSLTNHIAGNINPLCNVLILFRSNRSLQDWWEHL